MPYTPTPYVPMPEDELLALFDSLSNVGRWGPDDELGTVNFITPEKIVAAAQLVREGRVVSVAQDMSTTPNVKNRNEPAKIRMLHLGHEPQACTEEISYLPHGPESTHLDSVCHVYFEGRMWNGRLAKDWVKPDGMHFGSVFALRNGIVSRGVLLDVARARGVPWLTPDDHVTVEDFEAAEERQGVRVESGDVLLVRVGLGAREAVEGIEDGSFKVRCGLTPECVAWMAEREVSVFSGDCTEKMPAPYTRVTLPLHHLAAVSIGLNLVDHARVEELSEVCEELGRWEFLYTVAPLRIPKTTGSTVNPLCMF